MDPLATPEDLAAYLGRELTDAEAAKAPGQLAAASAAVRAYTKQTISRVENDEVTFWPNGAWLTLPQRPIVSVSQVAVDGSTVTDWRQRGDRLYRRIGWGWATTVTYTHGYAEVPADIVSVVCAVAMRGVTGANPNAHQSETFGDYSYRLAAGAEAGALGLLRPEKAILRRYRKSGGTVHLR